MKQIKKAILPVAGFGTRFLPATKAIPKEMLPIIDKPLIEYAVEEAVDAGIEEIIFITSHTKIAIENHFDTNLELEEKLARNSKTDFIELINPKKFKNIRFSYVRQKFQKGLGDAINHASHLINNEAFAILLADDLIFSEESCLKQLIKVYEDLDSSVIGVNEVSKEDISKYGVIDPEYINSDIRIKNLIEKPDLSEAPSNLGIVGRYILNSEIFKYLEKVKEDSSNEIQLTDALSALLVKGGLNAVETNADIYDCGNKLGYLSANLAIGMRDPKSRANIHALFNRLIDEEF